MKGKRGILKSLLARLRHEFNVSAAEVDAHDAWQRAVIGVACVSVSSDYAHGLLQAVADAVEHWRLCLLYTSPSPRDRTRYRMPSSA